MFKNEVLSAINSIVAQYHEHVKQHGEPADTYVDGKRTKLNKVFINVADLKALATIGRLPVIEVPPLDTAPTHYSVRTAASGVIYYTKWKDRMYQMIVEPNGHSFHGWEPCHITGPSWEVLRNDYVIVSCSDEDVSMPFKGPCMNDKPTHVLGFNRHGETYYRVHEDGIAYFRATEKPGLWFKSEWNKEKIESFVEQHDRWRTYP